MMTIPYVIENTPNGERGYDIYSRLLKDRIIMLTSEINDNVASLIVSQLLYLESIDDTKDIYLYINSPGGVVTAGLSIYDTMNFIKPDVVTICLGQAASMGAFLLSSGANGKRYSLPNSRIMIHQPLGGVQGQATDIEIHTKEILRMKEMLNSIMAKNSNNKTSLETMKSITERDNFLSAEESIEIGLIDKILVNRNLTSIS